MQNRSRRKRGVFALILTALACTAVYAITHRIDDPNFLHRATRITAMDTPWYCWRTDHQLLLAGPPPPTYRQRTRDLMQFDCDNHKSTRLAALNRSIFYNRQQSSISQDGTKLMLGLFRDYDRYRFDIVHLNSNQGEAIKFKIPESFYSEVSNPLYLTDSLHCVEMSYGEKGLFVAKHNMETKSIQFYPAIGYPRATQDWDYVGCKLLGFIHSDRLLCLPGRSCYISKKSGALFLFEVNIGPTPNLVEYALPLKTGEEVLDIALSPDSKRFALLIRSDRLPPYSSPRQFLSRWFPQMTPKTQSVISLRTVRRDGSDRHLLGDLPEEKETKEIREHEYRLTWLPGGKKVSFLSQGALWTLPSE